MIDQLFVDSHLAIASQLTLHDPGESAEPEPPAGVLGALLVGVLVVVGLLDAVVEAVLFETVLVGVVLVDVVLEDVVLVGVVLVGVVLVEEEASVVKVEDSLEVVSP